MICSVSEARNMAVKAEMMLQECSSSVGRFDSMQNDGSGSYRHLDALQCFRSKEHGTKS